MNLAWKMDAHVPVDHSNSNSSVSTEMDSASVQKGAYINYWPASTAELHDLGIPNVYRNVVNQPQSSVTSSSGETYNHNEKKKIIDSAAWRRLHVSKAKLASISEVATFLAGFAVESGFDLTIFLFC